MAEDIDIEQRLKETTHACIDTYEKWGADKYDTSKREELQEAVHELRKVASRLEIEMAAAERDEMNKKPIPMPSHRAARGKGAEDIEPQGGNNAQKGSSGKGKSAGNRGTTGGQRRQRRSSTGGSASRQQSGDNGNSSADEGNS